MDYNTQRQQILLKEYGRNIQVMVDNLLLIDNIESRSKQTAQLVELMRQFVQPGAKDNNDVTHKIWDDIFIISDFKLEVESPFPKPDAAVIHKKPAPLGYSYSQPKLKHYGKNIEFLVNKITSIEDGSEKENATIYVARLMKSFFAQYNKEVVEDEVIKEQLYRISSGKIKLDLEKIKSENLLDLSGVRIDNRTENVAPSRHRNNNGRSNNGRSSSNDRNTSNGRSNERSNNTRNNSSSGSNNRRRK
ncbi:MAG: DUF4290 domain-containing protein [Cytophagales bacterium]